MKIRSLYIIHTRNHKLEKQSLRNYPEDSMETKMENLRAENPQGSKGVLAFINLLFQRIRDNFWTNSLLLNQIQFLNLEFSQHRVTRATILKLLRITSCHLEFYIQQKLHCKTQGKMKTFQVNKTENQKKVYH